MFGAKETVPSGESRMKMRKADGFAERKNERADNGTDLAEPVLPLRGKVLVLKGAPPSVVYTMAVRCVLDTDRTVILVDGGCQVDPYRVAGVAKALGCARKDIDGLLRKILVSRAFTAHQLESLVSERLEPQVRRSRAAFAGVLDLDALFLDEQLDSYEGRIMKARCLRRLRAIALDCNIGVAVTEGSDRKHSRWGF